VDRQWEDACECLILVRPLSHHPGGDETRVQSGDFAGLHSLSDERYAVSHSGGNVKSFVIIVKSNEKTSL
jgi:hypothetical protein